MEGERNAYRRPEQKQCMYFMQGRCRFGNQCYNSHQGFTETLMIRHAQSEFNKIANLYPSQSFFQQPVKTKMHLNHQYIDCGLSEQGRMLCSKTYLPAEYMDNTRNLDLIFVSPLNRTLQTADIIIKANKLRVRKVVVLPELTEVLSKICDFSGSLKEKRAKYSHFDFCEMDRLIRDSQSLKHEDHWQDSLVDHEYKADILEKEKAGHRYIKILESIFPTPLENSERCFSRAMLSIEIMKQIIQRQKGRKVLLVSHNRILKYLDGRFSKGRATSFENCEIRKLIF